MQVNRVRAGATYFYVPNLLDAVDGRTNLKDGQEVRVVNLPGAPKCNTMGHAHVQHLDGTWGGLVHCNSLHTKAEYIAWLKRKVEQLEESRRDGAR